MTKTVWVRTLYFLLSFLILVATPGLCDDYYVDARNGSDITGDGSPSNPWKRLQFAIDSIEGTEANPHNIFIFPGSYSPEGTGDPERIFCDSFESLINNTDDFWISFVVVYQKEHVLIQGMSGIISIGDSTDVSINRCLLHDTTYGGLTLTNNAVVMVSNSTITRCMRAIDNESGSDLIINNCLFWGNDSDMKNEATISITFSNLEHGFPGEGNIQTDPLFVDPENGDYRLKKGSPCIDTGDPSDPVPSGGGTRIDMGCHEYLFEPEFTIDELTLNDSSGDNDGIPELGETIVLNPRLTNQGETATSIQVIATCDHPDVTLVNDSVTYPDLVFGGSSFATGSGFQFQVSGQSGWCSPADIHLAWTASGKTGELVIPFSLHSNESHIDPASGNNETGTGSPDLPWKTIDRAIHTIRGSRWMPLTIRAHAGLYSPSASGEVYPLYPGDYESIQGDGREITHLDNDGQDPPLIQSSQHNNFYDLHLKTESMSSRICVTINFCEGELKNCTIERKDQSPYYFLGGLRVDGKSEYVISNNRLFSSGGIGYFPGTDITYFSNQFYSCYNESGNFLQNTVIPGEFLFRIENQDLPSIISNNYFNLFDDYNMGLFYFTDNVFRSGLDVTPDLESIICRNIGLEVSSISVVDTSDPMVVSNNILLGYYDTASHFHTSMGSACFINNVLASMVINDDPYPGYFAMMGGYSLDNSVALFLNASNYWGATAWCRQDVHYYNHSDEAGCERTEYSDMNGCPLPTNIDADPGFVGVGTITDIGFDYIQDDTANWEPGKYIGLYVNPNILVNKTLLYCQYNDETTLYLYGDPSQIAAVGDLYFVPDFRLRRIADGFAYDSPLIDAGNPDPAYNDADGSRCDIGPWGGPYGATPLPDIPTWPPPTGMPEFATRTPTPSPTSTGTVTVTPEPSSAHTAVPTPTPSPSLINYDLTLNSTFFLSGDPFLMTRTIIHSGSSRQVFEMILLDVYGSYFFWPSWKPSIDGMLETIKEGSSLIVVLQFNWPPGELGHADELYFWGGLLDPQNATLIGNVDGVMFGY